MAEPIDVEKEAGTFWVQRCHCSACAAILLRDILARHTRWLADWFKETGRARWTASEIADSLNYLADKLERGEGI